MGQSVTSLHGGSGGGRTNVINILSGVFWGCFAHLPNMITHICIFHFTLQHPSMCPLRFVLGVSTAPAGFFKENGFACFSPLPTSSTQTIVYIQDICF